jgi:hypothetical protein
MVGALTRGQAALKFITQSEEVSWMYCARFFVDLISGLTTIRAGKRSDTHRSRMIQQRAPRENR